ncbi:MAG TPA: arsenate reductase ArsC [Candidatus Kapabacteria bacterium]|nr:arsenate reductase ArsC [Candidatus Kapabacteria bacterium]
MTQKRKILFLCTGNSCRSQMAQGLMSKLGGERFEAFSAGSYPSGYVHPLAIKTMNEMGIDISQNVSKSLDQYIGIPWNFIITVCDDAREACPVFPGGHITAHWGFEDPAKFVGGEAETRQFFREIARQIERRIQLFLALPEEKLSALEYEKAVKKIGDQ